MLFDVDSTYRFCDRRLLFKDFFYIDTLLEMPESIDSLAHGGLLNFCRWFLSKARQHKRSWQIYFSIEK